MSEHRARIEWRRETPGFTYEEYNREHTWGFDGGIEVPASAAQAYRGKPEFVDPEEAYVAALSSCHMLTFLAIAARKRYTVDRYDDDAVGYMEARPNGRLWVARVELRPKIAFSGDRTPDAPTLAKMHDQSHHECFIANSVRTEVVVVETEDS
jgi:organic hydroperoxide reductase OsmC/OhrA